MGETCDGSFTIMLTKCECAYVISGKVNFSLYQTGQLSHFFHTLFV